jgi:hypothetical protein
MVSALLLVLQLATPPVYDRVILGGRVIDPATQLDAVRNIGLSGGRIAVITTEAIRGRDTIDARGLVVAPGFIDLHAHGQTAETYRFYALDGVTTGLELELGTSDVAAWYRERSAGELINYGVSIGHIKVRMAVMHDSGTWMPVSDGAYRAASPAEIPRSRRIETGLREGAVDTGAGTHAGGNARIAGCIPVSKSTKHPSTCTSPQHRGSQGRWRSLPSGAPRWCTSTVPAWQIRRDAPDDQCAGQG